MPDFPSADAALALGVRPVGMAKVTYVPDDVRTWTKAALGGAKPALIDADRAIPLERIAALRPDVMLASDAFYLEPVHDKLSAIAPMVSWREGSGVDHWRDVTTMIGQALGREDRAPRRRRRRGARAARAGGEPRARRAHGLAVRLRRGTAYVINSESGFSIRFLCELGLRLTDTVRALKGESGARDGEHGAPGRARRRRGHLHGHAR